MNTQVVFVAEVVRFGNSLVRFVQAQRQNVSVLIWMQNQILLFKVTWSYWIAVFWVSELIGIFRLQSLALVNLTISNFSLRCNINSLRLYKHVFIQSRFLFCFGRFLVPSDQTKIAHFTEASLKLTPVIFFSLFQQLVHSRSDYELELAILLNLDELRERFETSDVEEDHPVVAEPAHFAFPYHQLFCRVPLAVQLPKHIDASYTLVIFWLGCPFLY